MTYRITRFCCLSGLCIDCHQRGNHGDTAKRARIVHADHLTDAVASRMLAGWANYGAKKEPEATACES